MVIKRIFWISCFIYVAMIVIQSCLWAQDVPMPPMDLQADLKSLSQMSNSDKEMIATAVGLPQTSDFHWGTMMAGIIFGSIGLVAFIYGKKNAFWKPMAIGILLMAFPYFITGVVATYLAGIILLLILYFWRD